VPCDSLGEIQRCPAVGVFCLKVRSIRNEEFDELVEATFCGAMQCGLVRHSKRARHLTSSTACSDGGLRARCSAVWSRATGSGSSTASAATTTATTKCASRFGERSGIDVRSGSDEQFHGCKHAFIGAVASASDARAEFNACCSHQWCNAFLARQIDERA